MRLFTRSLVVTLAVAAGVFFGGNSRAETSGDARNSQILVVRTKFVSIKLSEYEFITKQLNRMEQTLDRLERSQAWQVSVQNVARIDRENDLKRDACFDHCMKLWPRQGDPEYDAKSSTAELCMKPCQDLPKSPGGGGC